jgi:uncharacterized protein YkwD
MHFDRRFRWLILALVLIFASACDIAKLLSPTGDLTPAEVEQKTFRLVNEHRAGKGLPPLVWEECIAAECRAHSRDMADGSTAFGHTGFADRVNRIYAAIPGRLAGENVAYHSSAAGAVDVWLKSPEHLKLIENDFDLSAVGVSFTKDGSLIYFTQIFIKPR